MQVFTLNFFYTAVKQEKFIDLKTISTIKKVDPNLSTCIYVIVCIFNKTYVGCTMSFLVPETNPARKFRNGPHVFARRYYMLYKADIVLYIIW